MEEVHIMSDKINLKKIRVEVTLRNKKDMKGLIAIQYFGIRITHIRIMYDQDNKEYYVELPSVKVGWNYQRCVWIIDKDDLYDFKKLLLKKFFEFREDVKAGRKEDNHPPDEIEEEFFNT